MRRVRTTSTGWLGAPGLTTFYFTELGTGAADAAALVARVRAAWATMVLQFPVAIRYQVSGQVDTLDPATGNVTAVDIVSDPLPVIGTQPVGDLTSPQVAVLIRWMTDTFEAGRRIQGRTFITQLAHTTTIDSDGRISANAQSQWRTFGELLADIGGATGDLLVWRRPRVARTLPTPLSARVGSVAAVADVLVPNTPATLNSRRDA